MSIKLDRSSFSLSARVKEEYVGRDRKDLIERLMLHYLDAIKYWEHEPYRIVDIDKEGSPTLIMYESTKDPGAGVVRVDIED